MKSYVAKPMCQDLGCPLLSRRARLRSAARSNGSVPRARSRQGGPDRAVPTGRSRQGGPDTVVVVGDQCWQAGRMSAVTAGAAETTFSRQGQIRRPVLAEASRGQVRGMAGGLGVRWMLSSVMETDRAERRTWLSSARAGGGVKGVAVSWRRRSGRMKRVPVRAIRGAIQVDVDDLA